MRKYAWLVVWTTLLGGSLAQAQGPGYYNPPQALSGPPGQDFISLNTRQLMAWGLPLNQTYGQPPPQPMQTPPNLVPASNAAPTRRATILPVSFFATAPAGGTAAKSPSGGPIQQASGNAAVAPAACEQGCPPPPPVAVVPAEPVAEPKESHDEFRPHPYSMGFWDYFDFGRGQLLDRFLSHFDGTILPTAIYESSLLNALWRYNCDALPEVPYHAWVAGEYLNWRIKSAPIAVPLVTGNPNPTTIAALSDPGTTILFGAGSNQDTSFNSLSGGRLTLGYGFGKDCPVALETSAFLLQQGNILFSASSAGGTAPLVSIPFFATEPFNFINPGGETSLNAGGAANRVNIALASRLWGAEANLLFSPSEAETYGCLRLQTLLGFRYLNLAETLSSTDTFFDPTTNGTIVVADGFGTRNQFYGGQFGVRAGLDIGRWSVETSAKLALGSMNQTSNIAGSTDVSNGAFGLTSRTTPGGVFAEPSNIGSFHRSVFAYVPEGRIKLVYNLTQSIRPFVGYDFLYLSNVLRPGNQIDRNVNPTQNSFFVPIGGTIGPLSPSPFFRSSDFWAQGFNIGVECRF